MLEFLPMLKEDEITKKVNSKIKETEDEKQDFCKSYQIIFNEIQEIYKNANVKEIIERKNYLENCMDNPYQIFSTLALAGISWYTIEIVSELFNSIGNDGFIINILRILATIIASIAIFIYFSIELTKKTRLYMKYNLRDKELEIIRSKLSEKLDNIDKNESEQNSNET